MMVQLIAVPYHAGDDRHSSSEGPQRLLEAGANSLLEANVAGDGVRRIAREGAFRDTASSSAAVNRQVAAAVGEAMAADELPLVLAGSCAVAPGVLAGFDHSGSGVVWLDAHADFNTPESTASGFFPGMTMAVITGHCYRSYWAQIGDSTPIAEEAVVMIGVRDLSPQAERDRLSKSAIEVLPWREGRAVGDVEAALNRLSRRVDEVYLHIDMDAFDPEVAPGIVDEPVPGGLSILDAERIIRGTGERFRLRAVTLATFTPDRDKEGKTLWVALRLIQLVGEWAVRA